MLYSLASILSFSIFKCFFEIKIKGKDSLPRKGPFIIAANHVSNLDPFVVGSCAFPIKVSFLAKEELFYNKFSSFIFKDLGAIPLKRGSVDIGALKAGLKSLQKRPLVIFPQGSRSENFDKFSVGVGFLCKKTNVPVIAARIYGTEKSLSKTQKHFCVCPITIIFSKVDNIDENDDYEAITLKVKNKIKSL
ncbi:MAG: lysophospholipid acyltransferase family protein [Candidatus Omnitrophota bacterium]